MQNTRPKQRPTAQNDLQLKIRFSIQTKLLLLIFFILVISLGAVAWFGLNLFVADKEEYLSATVVAVGEEAGLQTKAKLHNIQEKLRAFANVSEYSFRSPKQKNLALNKLFNEFQRDFLYVGIYPIGSSKPEKLYFIKNVMRKLKESERVVRKELKKKNFLPLTRGKRPVYLTNVTRHVKEPVIQLAFRYKNISNKSVMLVTAFRQRVLLEKTSGAYKIFLLELQKNKGQLKLAILAHPDSILVHSRIDYSSTELKDGFETLPDNMETLVGKTYTDLEGKEMVAGLKRIKGTNIGIVSQQPKDAALASTLSIVKKLLFIILSVAIGALFIGFFFAGSLSRPILFLAEAAKKVAQGNFDLKIPVNSADEIGALASTFNFMTKGLKERDRVKQTFSRYVSKQVADKILSVDDELELTGEKKHVSIMFTDIRGFTSMSEKMEASEVVDILNRYFGKMVDIVFKYGGSLDKFMGDAMMVLFGVPLSIPQKELKAVQCAMELQKALTLLNKVFIKEGKPEIKMGIGINTGDVVAGNIGSSARLEYTVIGDNVNTAQRIEAATKPYNGGVLISQSTFDVVSNNFEFQKLDPIIVKGKKDALQLYMLIGEKSVIGQEAQQASQAAPLQAQVNPNPTQE